MWIEIDGVRAAPLWPPRYSARLNPLVVLDETGQERFAVGDRITTQMLGPSPQERDACGLEQQISVYVPTR